jgi:hypothetical protein
MILLLLPALYAFSLDYTPLYETVREYVRNNQDQIPPLVRLSFHDLMNYDPSTQIGGPNGCIREEPQRSMEQNNHLQVPADRLFNHVQAKLNLSYSDGDIISMAGKVAIEQSFCVYIPWRGGRPSCTQTEPEAGPMGNIQTMAGLQPFLDRYNFTANEMAILIAGAHAVKGARGRLSSPEPMFLSTVNSGTTWIKDTFAVVWAYFGTREDPGFRGRGILRLPIDMLFFPRSVRETIAVGNIGRPFADPAATPVEEYIVPFGYKSDKEFNIVFSNVFSKMLEIGANELHEFKQTAFTCQ